MSSDTSSDIDVPYKNARKILPNDFLSAIPRTDRMQWIDCPGVSPPQCLVMGYSLGQPVVAFLELHRNIWRLKMRKGNDRVLFGGLHLLPRLHTPFYLFQYYSLSTETHQNMLTYLVLFYFYDAGLVSETIKAGWWRNIMIAIRSVTPSTLLQEIHTGASTNDPHINSIAGEEDARRTQAAMVHTDSKPPDVERNPSSSETIDQDATSQSGQVHSRPSPLALPTNESSTNKRTAEDAQLHDLEVSVREERVLVKSLGKVEKEITKIKHHLQLLEDQKSNLLEARKSVRKRFKRLSLVFDNIDDEDEVENEVNGGNETGNGNVDKNEDENKNENKNE
ncbi:hypothetical protein P280DRAFT_503429 [Massarina eburnea CBS 473.64]|uniref:Uncharacterized protein n=1 Tax=Massarina eburnea CBS 473.64 TaxID=1395130 RepID=A0A6A6SED7_9PLEO|nr:hypothetical protein P280DRAFT_503429 [Massarina eburnea CBS 473.64]